VMVIRHRGEEGPGIRFSDVWRPSSPTLYLTVRKLLILVTVTDFTKQNARLRSGLLKYIPANYTPKPGQA
jgi:hypothetical protein